MVYIGGFEPAEPRTYSGCFGLALSHSDKPAEIPGFSIHFKHTFNPEPSNSQIATRGPKVDAAGCDVARLRTCWVLRDASGFFRFQGHPETPISLN